MTKSKETLRDRKSDTTYEVEVVRQNVRIPYENGTVTSLLVGIKDGESVSFFATRWKDRFGYKKINQYFFRDSKTEGIEPAGYVFRGYNGGNSLQAPSWPADLLPVIDDKIEPRVRNLIAQRPHLKEDLEECIFYLGWGLTKVPLPQ